jgi:hypothetical protein
VEVESLSRGIFVEITSPSLVSRRAHRADLILVLIHSPVEGAAVFRTDQRLRRTNTLSHVGHIEPVSIDHIVKMAAPLFFNPEAVNTFGGITSEGL